MITQTSNSKKDGVIGKDPPIRLPDRSNLFVSNQVLSQRPPQSREEFTKTNYDKISTIKQPEVFNFDFDIPQKDKKWIGQGVDITDYFNYGFTEDTFRMYANKIKILFKKNQSLLNKNLPEGDEENNILKDGIPLSLGGLEIIDNPVLHNFV